MLDLRTNDRGSDVRCPFCHSRVLDSERHWICRRCKTLHHEDCARENGRCTLLGCGEATIVERRPGEPPLPPVARSYRAVARRRQDFLVLGVSVSSVVLLFLAERQMGDREIGLGSVALALGVCALLAATLRWVRRRNRIGG
jgi:hypothetical protein